MRTSTRRPNTAVMAIGGFTGSDPTPTLSQFIDDVSHHEVTYYLVENNGNDHRPGGPTRDRGHADIAAWVAGHFTPATVGSATVYDLSSPR